MLSNSQNLGKAAAICTWVLEDTSRPEHLAESRAMAGSFWPRFLFKTAARQVPAACPIGGKSPTSSDLTESREEATVTGALPLPSGEGPALPWHTESPARPTCVPGGGGALRAARFQAGGKRNRQCEDQDGAIAVIPCSTAPYACSANGLHGALHKTTRYRAAVVGSGRALLWFCIYLYTTTGIRFHDLNEATFSSSLSVIQTGTSSFWG